MLHPGGNRRSTASSGWRSSGFRAAWCCSFAAPHSPDCRPLPRNPCKQPDAANLSAPKFISTANSLHSSPSPSSKLGRGIIDPRRILSPGRVSPIDSDVPLVPLPERAGSFVAIEEQEIPYPLPSGGDFTCPSMEADSGVCDQEKGLDLKLKLTGRNGRRLVMEMDSGVLCASSSYFATTVLKSRPKVSDTLNDCWEIEIEGVEDLDVFRETIEMMYDRDEMNWLMKAGVSRVIDVLEVSASIMFDRGTRSCLKYLEAVPWSEHEEEKLKSLFSSFKFDASITEEVLARLHSEGPSGSEELAVQLIKSVANGTNGNARKELQALVNGLLSKSSVYSKELAGLNKDSLYSICCTCMNSLVELFKEASSSVPTEPGIAITKEQRPPVERVSKQVENLNWLLDILIEKQMAVNFVCLWGAQDELARLHQRTSPMIRYELSRISASVFMAMGRGKVQCCGDARHSVLCRWFRPLLLDFGWIQRCPKGLDMRMLEEGLGQAILTLPLKQQQTLFVEWFQFFGTQGRECPNLSKAFQVWWRRSFVRGVETHS
ncbi:BTB/POZ domain-containing protein At2g13690 [Phalaenopsis equestris]|uniref:BTB/POZ domain-containing protein At2g13690 n=1 Tax=Phalaenopsis equestris TaxID=78828 RepID=UPI0009E19E51|nr:BTB/POZ domain-containing protein At2g13690 [Phalaenopsis equestris]